MHSSTERPHTSRRHAGPVCTDSGAYPANSTIDEDKTNTNTTIQQTHNYRERSARPRTGYKVRHTESSAQTNHQQHMIDTHAYDQYSTTRKHSTHQHSVVMPVGPTRERTFVEGDLPMDKSHSSTLHGLSSQKVHRPPSSRASSRIVSLADDVELLSMHVPATRPSSASIFSKYHILPGIGESTSNTREPKTEEQLPNQQENGCQPKSGYSPPMQKNMPLHEEDFHEQVIRKFQSINTTDLSDADDLHYLHDPLSDGQVVAVGSKHSKQDTEIKRDIQQTKNTEESTIRIPTANQTETSSNNNTVRGHKQDHAIVEYPILRREITLSEEPKETEDRMLLAIKLPSGQRIQRFFRPTQTLRVIIQFAEAQAHLDFSHCHLVFHDGPRSVLTDLNVRIRDTPLKDRTVLHIEIPDE